MRIIIPRKAELLVQYHAEEGTVDLEPAVVLDEAQFSEFVHEEIDPRPRCPNHLRQHLLRHFGQHLLRLALRTIARQQQQRPRQPLLAGIEQLIDEGFFDADVPRQHVRDKAVRSRSRSSTSDRFFGGRGFCQTSRAFSSERLHRKALHQRQ